MGLKIAATVSLTLFALAALPAAHAENRIDGQRPDAPELAAYGELKVGVRTIELTNPGQINIIAIDPAKPKPDPLPTYDRTLTVEVWYPAASDAGGPNGLKAFLRDGTTEVTLLGQAMRDAAPANGQSYPLVIISHGYPGNRFLLSHLAENIASKGYVVASIDHRESTYRDQSAFGSTLINRSLDQKFVLDEIARLSADSSSFLSGIADHSNTAIIGYSMGGYGAVITAGGGVTQTSIDYPWGGPHGLLAVHKSGSDSHASMPDARIKTAIAFAPWGMNYAFWDAETLKGVKIPMMFVAGSKDDVSGYENGIHAIWKAAVNVDRSLLTFENANHNAGAPYPAPAESHAFNEQLGFAPFDHYADAVWDTVRMNNVSQHFVTAWLGKYLKADTGMDAYLDLVPVAADSVWAANEDGSFKPEHNYWKGFQNRTALGLRYERLSAGE
ncbi:MAG: alpha/beta hydrolase family protein [Rhizobiaceae bacterium]